MTSIMIILARISMTITYVSIYFMDFIIRKVSLSFKDTRGWGLFFLMHRFMLTSITFNPTIRSYKNFIKTF
jgi:hypothetical protein